MSRDEPERHWGFRSVASGYKTASLLFASDLLMNRQRSDSSVDFQRSVWLCGFVSGC